VKNLLNKRCPLGSDDLLISKIKPNRDKALMLAKRAVGVLVHDSI
jgi:hypothetical protein